MKYTKSCGTEVEISEMKVNHLLNAQRKIKKEQFKYAQKAAKQPNNAMIARKHKHFTELLRALNKELDTRKTWEEY